MVSVGQEAFAAPSSANCPASMPSLPPGAGCEGDVGLTVADAGLCGGGAGAAGEACVGAGEGLTLGSGVDVVFGKAPPALHCSTKAFSVTPRACIPALSARHSAVHSLAVFREDEALVDGDGATTGGGVAALGLGGGAEGAGAAPTLHCSTYAFSVTPRACMPALSARHSAVHSFAVFDPVTVACLGAGDDAVSAGFAAGRAAVGPVPPLHCSTYAFSVTPRACIPALSARHSTVHSFAVFAKAGVAEMLHTTAATIKRQLSIFIFVLQVFVAC